MKTTRLPHTWDTTNSWLLAPPRPNDNMMTEHMWKTHTHPIPCLGVFKGYTSVIIIFYTRTPPDGPQFQYVMNSRFHLQNLAEFDKLLKFDRIWWNLIEIWWKLIQKMKFSFNLMELTQLFCLNLIPSNENTKIMFWLETIRILCMASTEPSKNW